jgi:hypothetical protein
MYSRQGNPDPFAEPLVLLSTYRLATHYRAAERDHLIDVARSAQPLDRSRLLLGVQRVIAGLRTWYRKINHGPQTGARIPAQAAAVLAAE